MQEKANVPAIRFAGFTDAWEQRKLGDFAEFYNGDRSPRYPKDSELVADGVPFINAGDLVNGRVKLDTANKITETKYSELSGAKIQLGDIIYCLRGTLGKNAFVDNFNYGTVASSLVDIRPKDIDGKYLFHVLNSDIEYKQRVVHDEGAAQPNLSAKNLSEFTIPVPKKQEQKRISSFLDSLDHLITLHQRKYTRLCNVKKSMLEKMFPRDGASVPEIRFAGFTDAWEQWKVGDYYEFRNGLNKGKEYFGAGTPIVNFTDVFHKRGLMADDLKGRVTLEASEIANFRVKKGDLFFTRTSETVEEIGYPSVMLEDIKDTVFSGFVLRGRTFLDEDPLDDLFKKYVFFTEAFRKEMTSKSSMTTRALTSGTAIKNMQFYHPVDKMEQRQIGEYFTHLDHLITLHQRELERLQNIKKSCLEKMFV